jgi:hypothetical protein
MTSSAPILCWFILLMASITRVARADRVNRLPAARFIFGRENVRDDWHWTTSKGWDLNTSDSCNRTPTFAR